MADCLDISLTLNAFPGMTRQELGVILSTAAELFEEMDGKAALWVDGASRGNPGQAGAGFVLEKGGKCMFSMGEYLGEATNNEAEYKALILGMEEAKRRGLTDLEIFSDSQLMVRQMTGEYRIKSPGLQDLYFQAVKGLGFFRRVAFNHVPREKNRQADKMANMAIDVKGKVSL